MTIYSSLETERIICFLEKQCGSKGGWRVGGGRGVGGGGGGWRKEGGTYDIPTHHGVVRFHFGNFFCHLYHVVTMHYIHTHTHTHTITHMLTHTHSHTLTHSHAHSHTHAHTYSHTRSHIHTHTLTYTHMNRFLPQMTKSALQQALSSAGIIPPSVAKVDHQLAPIKCK